MLHEIKMVKQEQGPGRRRWFESEGLELVVWLDREDAMIGFQLCYDLGQGEHALTWRKESGFAHSRIDMGDDASFVKLTPILEPDASVPWQEIARLFEQRSKTLELGLARMIRGRLAERAKI